MEDTQQVLLFMSAKEFEERPGFQYKLTVGKNELDRIVGKYDFDELRALRCGLNSCNKIHWHGFVIRTKSGMETICGKDCGEREFQTSWKSVLAEYNRLDADRQTREWLTNFLQKRSERIEKANQLIIQLQERTTKIEKFTSLVRENQKFRYDFYELIMRGGEIKHQKHFSEDERELMSDGQSKKSILVKVAQVDGTLVFKLDPQRNNRYMTERCIAELRFKVVDALKEAGEVSISQIDRKARAALESKLKGIDFILSNASDICKAGFDFFKRDNISKLSLLMPEHPSDAAYIVRKLGRVAD